MDAVRPPLPCDSSRHDRDDPRPFQGIGESDRDGGLPPGGVGERGLDASRRFASVASARACSASFTTEKIPFACISFRFIFILDCSKRYKSSKSRLYLGFPAKPALCFHPYRTSNGRMYDILFSGLMSDETAFATSMLFASSPTGQVSKTSMMVIITANSWPPCSCPPARRPPWIVSSPMVILFLTA